MTSYDYTDYGPEVERAARLLPAWFVPRMMTDEWSFAFIMVSGDVVHLTTINAVHLGVDGVWLDVNLNEHPPQAAWFNKSSRQITSPTGRRLASINARHIMIAFETAD
jgi:hypothetical protein